MTAPSGPEWDAVVEAGEDGAYRYLDGGKGDVDVPVMVTRVLLAALPSLRAMIRRETVEECVDAIRPTVGAFRERYNRLGGQNCTVGEDCLAALRALLPPSGGPPKEGE